MSLPTSHLAYPDCVKVLDAALDNEAGVRVQMVDEASCIRFRMRCNQVRVLQRQFNTQAFDKGHPQHGASAWDALVIRYRQDDGKWYIYVERVSFGMGEIEPLGETVPQIEHEPQRALPPPTDDFADSTMVVENVRRRV